jgi:glucosamine--fructose-6-phosphate aminotransferase (isomerizing)
MCGIYGYLGKKDTAAKVVLQGLKRLEYRGYDSWGVAVMPESKSEDTAIVVKKRVGKIGEATVDEMPASTFAVGHTRWATHGGVTEENAHPHLDCSQKVSVIHNGIVENYLELKEGLKKPHSFLSETDTEVVAHLLAEKIAKKSFSPELVREVFIELKGNNAIIVTHAGSRMIVAAKNGSPLIVGKAEDGMLLSSDPAALLPHTKQVYFVEDGQMVVLTDDTAQLFDIATNKKIDFEFTTLEWDVEQTTKGEYQYFMEKEIREQPAIIERIALQGEHEIRKIAELITQHDDVLCIGCGTASYAAWAATYLFAEIAGKKVDWAAASEFEHRLPFITDKTLVIALSQSGETMDLISVLNVAKKQKAKIVAVVNVLGSTLYRMADQSLLIGAGPEKAVASTKAFIAKLSQLVRLAYLVADDYRSGQKLLKQTAASSSALLADSSWKSIKNIAEKLHQAEHLFVMGRSFSTVASFEAALKIKEISYIHAEGIVGGELKHGPLALIEEGTACIVYVPPGEQAASSITSATEIKARGGYIVGVAAENDPIFDDFIQVNDDGIATLLTQAIVGQILAYEITLLRNLDPDMPRNLAKSVTVG